MRKPRNLLGALLAVLLLIPAVGDEPTALSKSQIKWVDRTLKQMTLEERVGQLLMVGYFGDFANQDSAAIATLEDRIRNLHVGGVVVMTSPQRPRGYRKSRVYGLTRMTNRLQSMAKYPLLVAADFERGAHFRVETSTDFPYMMTLGAAGDPELAYELGRLTALEARAMGVHLILAPVADVNNNPGNPVINIRSFGEDPAAVSRQVEAFVRGVQENGALATAKHFPGHGDTATDSHLSLPVITGDRARLDNVELPPFRAAIGAGVSSVMPGHLYVPAIEPEENVPATFSKALLEGLLRGEMGFDGLIVTDAMSMNAISEAYWVGEAAVLAFEAGADIILVSPDPRVAFDSLLRAARTGRISRERLDASVRRILGAKARVNLHENSDVPLAGTESAVASKMAAAAARKMAEKGVALLRDDGDLIPMNGPELGPGLLLVLSGDPSTYPADALEREIAPRVDKLTTVRTDPIYFPPVEIELPDPEEYDWAIIAVSVRVASYRAEIGLPEEMKALADQVLAADKPTAVVVLGSPYASSLFPDAKTVLLTFGTANVSQRAAGRALFGESPISGRLPVTIPGVAAVGAGLDRIAAPMILFDPTEADTASLAPVYAVLDQAVHDGVTPGGVLAVGHKGRLLTVHPFGRFTYDEKSPEVQAGTIYDIASLTKVVATTTATMRLQQRGRLNLDMPIVRFLPEFIGGPAPDKRKQITVRHLLTHSSGLPAYVRFFLDENIKNRAQVLDQIYAIPLEYEPGSQVVYSDLGIILLGEILSRASGLPFEELIEREVIGPLGMTSTRYNPPRAERDRIAPTEVDSAFRKRLVHAEVHDENTFLMGGVSSHAGLFSNARDLSAFCQMLLNGGIYGHKRLLKRDTIDYFTRKQSIPDSTRALGWDTPSQPPDYSSGGKHLSANAYGHTGFTGTSIWIDPDKDLFIILLTNRVHPTRENGQIRDLRPAVADAVIETLVALGKLNIIPKLATEPPPEVE